jgi:hypothetical protein
MPSTRSTSEPDTGLEALLRDELPEERERVIRAWHSLLQGDPESTPVQFALVTRGMAKALAATVKSAGAILADAGAVRSEADQARRNFALEADRKLAELSRLMDDGKKLPGAIEAAATAAKEAVRELGDPRPRRFGAAGVFWILAIVAAAFWIGGEWRLRQEQNTVGSLLNRWERGDGDAYRELIGRIAKYREIHQETEGDRE